MKPYHHINASARRTSSAPPYTGIESTTNYTREKPVYSIARGFKASSPIDFHQNNYIAQIEEIIKDKNDSLTYAKTLQDAIIPCKDNLKNVFPESFVYHLPKEIVSGDFCWFEEVGDTVFLAAADCTGHGVPGAMLTMVCCALLSKAVVEYGIKEPGKILDKVRDMVLRAFNGSEVDMNDGMDISLCAINKKTLLIEWSGANNPLLYFRNGEMFEINGDKQPVGRYERYLPFTTHTRQLHEGDTLYMFSDGYMDQFGGTKGKKFMYKNLKQVFTELKPVNMQAQKEILDNTFQEWKRDLEQVDDVLVIGVKL